MNMAKDKPESAWLSFLCAGPDPGFLPSCERYQAEKDRVEIFVIFVLPCNQSTMHYLTWQILFR